MKTGPARSLKPAVVQKMALLCKRAYRALGLTGYARIDLSMTDDGRIFIVEANPNSELARYEEFAEAADHKGLTYNRLIAKILSLGISYGQRWNR